MESEHLQGSGQGWVFCRNRGTYVGAVCTTVLQTEAVEDLHLSCGWKTGYVCGGDGVYTKEEVEDLHLACGWKGGFAAF